MAQHIVETPVAETMVTRTRAQRAWNPLQWAAIFGVIEAMLAVALIVGVAIAPSRGVQPIRAGDRARHQPADALPGE